MSHEFSIGSLSTMLADLFRNKQPLDYYQYIHSKEWGVKADAAKRRAGGRCQVCNSPKRLTAHHRTYANLGNEKPEDITVLCKECHTIFYKAGKLWTSKTR